MGLVEDRMVELAWKAYHGDYTEIVKLAEACGFKVEQRDGVLAIEGMVNTGIMRGLDPVNILVCLGFAFFGSYWAWVMPKAIEKIRKLWREEVKRQKKEAKR